MSSNSLNGLEGQAAWFLRAFLSVPNNGTYE